MEEPILPLGHDGGSYYFIPPCGQLRKFSAEALEAGRGVRALFCGTGAEIDEWCRRMFPARDDDWSPKAAGLWIIERCNARGLFDPATVDLRSIGVWRDEKGTCVCHCGDRLVYPDGHERALIRPKGKHIMTSATPIAPPEVSVFAHDAAKHMLHAIEGLWGWKRPSDAAIWLGWVAAASLGGFPEWRSHLYVHGHRGSGKSKLIELAACLMGDLAGDVVNDATEAGLRQSRNNQARPLLIDEFEPDQNPRNATRQDNMLAMFRRMSGGAGGRTSRGGADHSPISFRTLGAVYVTSINHIQLEPQDRSRFAVLELQALPPSLDPSKTALDLERLFGTARDMSPKWRGWMLAQSERWDETLLAISARARNAGADARQATTAATILTGLDLALFDRKICEQRLVDLGDPMRALLDDASEADEASEGRDALDHLLSTALSLDHGVKRSTRELILAVASGGSVPGVEDPASALKRHGIYVVTEKREVALRSGRQTPTARLYADTKWRNGAHASALKKLNKVIQPPNAVRLAPNEQHRVLLVPFEYLDISS